MIDQVEAATVMPSSTAIGMEDAEWKMEDYSHNGHEHSLNTLDFGEEEHSQASPVGLSYMEGTSTAPTYDVDHYKDNDDSAITLLQSDFSATCRLAARLGAAAMNNGSIAENIEHYLPKLMEVYGYYGFFSCSTLVLSCNFEKRPQPANSTNNNYCMEDTIVRTQNVSFDANFQLTKLGLLSDLAKDLVDFNIGIPEASQRLDEIEAAPDPWGPRAFLVAFMLIGATLPAILNGTWWDMLVGPFAGGLAYGTMRLFAAGPHGVHIWCDLCASFGCATLACLAQQVQPQIDPTIVTVSGVLCLIPSSTITLGINDLVSRHVLSGLERLVKGMIIMLWLALGYVVGMSFVAFMVSEEKGDDNVSVMEEMEDEDTIPALWQLLFIPILCSCVAVIFQMSGKDMVGAMMGMFLGYGTSFSGIFFFDQQPYLGSFMGSFVIATYANAWSRYYDRPNTIILFPAFQLVVAGIVGFMGLTKIIQGSSENTEEGTDQVQHMLVVAGVVVIGFLVGGTLVQPRTTI